jgi:hypothetical protein
VGFPSDATYEVALVGSGGQRNGSSERLIRVVSTSATRRQPGEPVAFNWKVRGFRLVARGLDGHRQAPRLGWAKQRGTGPQRGPIKGL